jgi:predicted TPR repeat methyltransferase
VAAHLLAALGADATPPRAADAYVKQTFDRFAADFDATLARLDYRAPELVAEALARALGPPRGDMDVLDLGCGTGLCAPLLRPRARRLIGVDLSPAMLERARRRGGYDTLHEGELTAFLREHTASWDVIACADTLCYLGDLGPALRAAATALRREGVLVFTVERMTEAHTSRESPAGAAAHPFALEPHGRYLHDEAYVRAALAAAGFAAEAARVTLRMEGGRPVEGLLCLARPARASDQASGSWSRSP